MPCDKDNDFHDLLLKRHERELERSKNLDEKANRLIQSVTIIIAITITIGSISLYEILTHIQLFIPFFLGISLLIASIILSLLASLIRKWEEIPSLELLNSYSDPTITAEILRLEENLCLAKAVSTNLEKNEKKAIIVFCSSILLIAGLICLAAFLGIIVQNPTWIKPIKS